MKDIICKLAHPGGIVVHCCAGTLSLAEACIRLPQHERFVGIDLDSESAASSLSQLNLIFARHVLKEKSDIAGEDEVQQAGFAFVKIMEDLSFNFRINVWEAPAGLSILQAFSLQMV